MANVESVEGYHFTPQDRLFFDTNIWLYLLGPQKPRNRVVEIYSQMFLEVLRRESQLFIDVLVLSEFFNTYSRILFNHVQRQNSFRNFKEFRNSAGFIGIAQDISVDAMTILKHCSRLESGFSTLDINGTLDNYTKGSFDFNDQIIADLCRVKDLMLITHDFDFRKQDLPLLTANRRLLNYA